MTPAFLECLRELFRSKRAAVCIPYCLEGRFEEVLANYIRLREAIVQIEYYGLDHK